eukprot:SAG25_NODE_11859_length_293_cov_0.804124_2_plen_69_part_01
MFTEFIINIMFAPPFVTNTLRGLLSVDTFAGSLGAEAHRATSPHGNSLGMGFVRETVGASLRWVLCCAS